MIFKNSYILHTKANQLLACHIYERMTVHCYNQYGAGLDFYKPECIVIFLKNQPFSRFYAVL